MAAESEDRNPYEPPALGQTRSASPRTAPGDPTVRRLIYFHLAVLPLAAGVGLESVYIGLLPIVDNLVFPIVVLASLAMAWTWPVVVLVVLLRAKLSLGARFAVFTLDCLISCFQVFLMTPAFQ